VLAEPAAPRNIVICLDGTRNSLSLDASNVFRLFEMIDERAGQLRYYDPGVGTFAEPGGVNWLKIRSQRLLGDLFGYGLAGNVIEAYRFLCEHYRAGDALYLFGFSRGAYTARALAGMIHKLGLLPAGTGHLDSYLVRIAFDFDNFELAGRMRHAFSVRRPGVRFLGLFDTVKSAYYFDLTAKTKKIRTILPFTYRNPAVAIVRHALAIDERRAFFPPNLWIEPTVAGFPPGQDVMQVWFAGGHGDVGGGHPRREAGLASVALRWMAGEAAAAGLHLDAHRRSRLSLPPGSKGPAFAPADPRAPLHDALRTDRAWWLAEVLPRRRTNPSTPGRRLWTLPLGRRREVAPGAFVHTSVRERMADPGCAYRPANLPPTDSVFWVNDQ
jgi:uncharacterized protein (DUF2235 family)